MSTTLYNVYICGHATVDHGDRADYQDRKVVCAFTLAPCSEYLCASTDPSWFVETYVPKGELDIECIEAFNRELDAVLANARQDIEHFDYIGSFYGQLFPQQVLSAGGQDIAKLLLEGNHNRERGLREYLQADQVKELLHHLREAADNNKLRPFHRFCREEVVRLLHAAVGKRDALAAAVQTLHDFESERLQNDKFAALGYYISPAVVVQGRRRGRRDSPSFESEAGDAELAALGKDSLAVKSTLSKPCTKKSILETMELVHRLSHSPPLPAPPSPPFPSLLTPVDEIGAWLHNLWKQYEAEKAATGKAEGKRVERQPKRLQEAARLRTAFETLGRKRGPTRLQRMCTLKINTRFRRVLVAPGHEMFVPCK